MYTTKVRLHQLLHSFSLTSIISVKLLYLQDFLDVARGKLRPKLHRIAASSALVCFAVALGTIVPLIMAPSPVSASFAVARKFRLLVVPLLAGGSALSIYARYQMPPKFIWQHLKSGAQSTDVPLAISKSRSEFRAGGRWQRVNLQRKALHLKRRCGIVTEHTSLE